ncbi:WD repeat-containing protein 6 [Apophysomyces ossiformis]|uniref:WD repeat-containing protein 6 n=1 Tax=Apophysomyces ossiformis TaxID=679940 RepID=A0A8H7BN26_9FUNG|nr:WD repeat-containing protein 6 [Apophysomyces ossiformis]
MYKVPRIDHKDGVQSRRLIAFGSKYMSIVQLDISSDNARYSARFFGTTLSTLILASGTVFNEVHLWKVNEKNKDEDGIVHKKLIGHEGVIFGIRFNVDGTLLSSVSDDRTIRIWPLTDETGSENSQKPLVIFGHTARVWDCQFVDEYLVSISEDTTCRVWKNSLLADAESQQEDSDVDCLACWEGHSGKNVWSCAVSPEHAVIATGGQDSGIRLWSLLSIKRNKIGKLHLERKKQNKRRPESPWTCLHQDDDYRSYVMMQHSPCGRIVVTGSIAGHILIASTEDRFKPLKYKVHAQKIFAMHIESSTDKNVFYIISHAFNSEIYFHRLDITTSSAVTLKTLYRLELPVERTTILSVGLVERNGLLICGSRESALLIYRLPQLLQPQFESIRPVTPSMQLRRSHGRETVSSITVKPQTEDKDITFWTTGRDGSFIQYKLRSLLDEEEIAKNECTETKLGVASRGETVTESRDLILEKIYRNKVTKGWLEGAVYVDQELLLLGFYRKRFFVYNESKNFEMISVACGGAHRRWHFTTEDAKLNTATFSFIRKELLYGYIRNGENNVAGAFEESLLQENYHGREVRAIKFMKYFDEYDDNQPLLFITGGEDTILRLQQYMPDSDSKFTTLLTIRKHISVIKNIEYSRGISNLLFTSGANEELRCWKLQAKRPLTPSEPMELHCLEVASCPFVSEISETRIMDTTVYTISPTRGLHLIGAVYSDAMIRIWLFNENTRRFSLVVDGTWHAKCILQITHVLMRDSHGHDRLLFFTSATDGRIALWDIHEQLQEVLNHEDLEVDPTKPAMKLSEPAYSYQAHMSGVNALEVVSCRAIITGGEDNALVGLLVRYDNGSYNAVGKPLTIPDAHASSITGLNVKDNTVYTTSTDQRLNVWTLRDLGSEGVSLTMASAAFVDVPDPSAMDIIEYK